MPKGNRSASLVENFQVQTELVRASQGLDSKGFVNLHRVHTIQLPSNFFAKLLNGFNRSQPHQGGITANGRGSNDSGARTKSIPAHSISSRNQEQGSAVIDSGCIPSRNSSIGAKD